MNRLEFKYTPPEWKNNGTEPDKELKEKGFIAGYKPPAGYFNWFWCLTGKCLKELQEKIKESMHTIESNDRIYKESVQNLINAIENNDKDYKESIQNLTNTIEKNDKDYKKSIQNLNTIGNIKQVKGQIGVAGYSNVYANIIFQQLTPGRANLFLQGKFMSKPSDVGNDFKFIDAAALKNLLELSSITWNTLQTEVTLDNLSAMAELPENDIYGYTGLKLSSCNSSTVYLNFSRQYTEANVEGSWSLSNALYNTNLYFTAAVYGLEYKN